ncbi:MAG: hypothetical protein U0Q12_05525 [Vicinamibacterales bacterium]
MKMRRPGPMALLAYGASLVVAGLATLTAQTYSSGQTVSPAYEGWTRNPDGSFALVFGYMNRNWEEEIDVPVGPENTFEPGVADRGQPTHFQPRRNRFVFRVNVPQDFGDKELVWTLTTRGKTEKAFGSLRADYFIDDVVMASETGALGAGTSSPEIRANQRPTVAIEGSKVRHVRVGEALSLVAAVADDGVPKPRASGVGAGDSTSRTPTPPSPERTLARALTPPSRITVAKIVGLHVSWFVYRGEGRVTFTPAQVKAWEDTRTGANSPWAPLWVPPEAPGDGRWRADATFDRPGTYVVRALADDGALLGVDEVTVVVEP